MSELRKLNKPLVAVGVQLDARWLPSAVNRFEDSLSWMWTPIDVRASDQLLQSIKEQYTLDRPAFCARPLNEPLPARVKQIGEQIQEQWGDGRARFWKPPFGFIQIVVRYNRRGGQGVLLDPFWPEQAWFARLIQISTRIHVLDVPAHDIVTKEKPLNPACKIAVVGIRLRTDGQRPYKPPCWSRLVTLPTLAARKKPPNPVRIRVVAIHLVQDG